MKILFVLILTVVGILAQESPDDLNVNLEEKSEATPDDVTNQVLDEILNNEKNVDLLDNIIQGSEIEDGHKINIVSEDEIITHDTAVDEVGTSLDDEVTVVDDTVASTDVEITSVPTSAFVEYYNEGKKAYLANNWKKCVKNMELAIDSYVAFEKATLKCKVKCKAEVESSFKPLHDENIENLHFYEKMVKQTLCLLNCKNSTMKDFNIQIPKNVLDDLEGKMPYDYLQLCYYQMKDLTKAASAAYTYFVHNPDNTIMKDNVQWYSSMVKTSDNFINNEPMSHSKSYLAGVEAYNGEKWSESVNHFEQAIKDFMDALENCRLDCEKPFDMGWFPEFVTSVANHFVFCLKCKLRCQEKLSNIEGKKIDDLLPLMYNYLQFSYYKTGQIQEAVASVESFLLLLPDEVQMISNKNYYLTEEKADNEWFKARPEAEKFYIRDLYERDLLEFVITEFSFYNPKEDSTAKTTEVKIEVDKSSSVRGRGESSPLPPDDLLSEL